MSNKNNIKQFDVISYPAGKEHAYKPFLVTQVTKNGLVTMPITDKYSKHKFTQRYNVRLSIKSGAKLSKKLHSRKNLYVNPTEVAHLTPQQLAAAKPRHITNLRKLDNLEANQHLQTSLNKAINQVAKDYMSYRKLISSNLPKNEIKQELHDHPQFYATTDNIKHALIAPYLAVKDKPHEYHSPYKIAPYKTDRTWHFNRTHLSHHDYNKKYADLDKIKPMSIIRYQAETGAHDKQRPFLVDQVTSKGLSLIPISHTLPGQTFTAVYHSEVPSSVAHAISRFCGDDEETAKHNRTALVPANRIKVKFSDFEKRQLPQYLGNLHEKCSNQDIIQMQSDSNSTIGHLANAYARYQKLKANHKHIDNYERRYRERDLINDKDLGRLHIAYELNGANITTPEDIMQPVYDDKYLALKKQNKVQYGTYQNYVFKKHKSHRPHKQHQQHKQQDFEPEL